MSYWLSLALGGAATYLVRALPLVVTLPWTMPPWLRRYLDALPIAVIAALAGAGIAVPDGAVTGGAEVLGAVTAVAIARARKNLLFAVLGGVLVVALLRGFGL